MENKYAKESNKQVIDKERLVDYDYKTDFKFEVVKVENKDHENELETIIGEFPLALVINGEYSNTFLCTPENLEQLVAGFLMTKGLIKSKCDIKSITCTIGVQGKQTCWSMIIINLTDEKIEIPTNNIFDVNSLPLSAILKNNAKSTK